MIGSGGEKGAKGNMRPGRHCVGAPFGGAKIWNYEIWPFLTNWRLHYTQ